MRSFGSHRCVKGEKVTWSTGRTAELGEGSVLEQTVFGHPRERGERLLTSGVLQLEQVAHFTDGLQCLGEAEIKGVIYVNNKSSEDSQIIKSHTSAQTCGLCFCTNKTFGY